MLHVMSALRSKISIQDFLLKTDEITATAVLQAALIRLSLSFCQCWRL